MRTKLLTSITSLVTWFFGIAVLAIVIANIAALGWLPGTTANPTCVDIGDHAAQLRQGAYATPSGASVCVDDPSAAQRIADMGDQIPQALFALGALWLLLRFLRTASQDGPHAATVPGRLAALGWFVLVCGPVSELLFAVSQHFLRTSMVSGVGSSGWLATWWAVFPWWSIAAGAGALVFAHLQRRKVTLSS